MDKVPLPRVYVGYRAPSFGDTRLDALDIAAQVLAGGKGSRLHRRLVRDERIAQDVALFTLGFIGGASVAAGWATVPRGRSQRWSGTPRGTGTHGREPVTDDELERPARSSKRDRRPRLVEGAPTGCRLRAAIVTWSDNRMPALPRGAADDIRSSVVSVPAATGRAHLLAGSPGRSGVVDPPAEKRGGGMRIPTASSPRVHSGTPLPYTFRM